MKVKLYLILLFSTSIVSAQSITTLLKGNNADSSFYDIIKVDDNEYWAAGEYGILKKIDTLGNISAIPQFANTGKSILKLVKTSNYIFIATAEGLIYRYDLSTKTFIQKEFPNYKNRCFYNIIVLKNGKLLVCGGNSAIAKDQKRIPYGFIALVDQDLTHIDLVWKCYRKFVWSIVEQINGNVLAVAFDALNTQIIESKDYRYWKTVHKIRGMVYNISIFDNQLWYIGAKSILYKKNGMIGVKFNKEKRTLDYNAGCIWAIGEFGKEKMAVSNSGQILTVDNTCTVTNKIQIPEAFTLYDYEKISDTKIITVGHGRSAYLVDFSSQLNAISNTNYKLSK